MTQPSLRDGPPPASLSVHLTSPYHRSPRWLPRLGDSFPDFHGTSTQGPFGFHAWAPGQWTVLFGQPGAFSPVCTTELGSYARAAAAFAVRGARPVCVAQNSVPELSAWVGEVERLFGAPVTFPIVSDECGVLCEISGMTHPKDNGDLPSRRTFLIDPALRIRMILDYPARIGRSTDEILRLLDALRAQDRLDVAVPADWGPGDDFLVHGTMDDAAATRSFGERWVARRPYLRFVPAGA